jgi:hypothetical protein
MSKATEGKVLMSPLEKQHSIRGGVIANSSQVVPARKIHPKNDRKVRWDIFVASLVVYSAVSVPYRVAFNVPATGMWGVFDVFVDFMFALDMVLNFFTGYEKPDGNLEFGTIHIAWHYLCTWFVIDFLSTLPIDRIMARIDGYSFVDFLSLHN